MGLNSNPGQPPYLIPGIPSAMGNSQFVGTDSAGNLAATAKTSIAVTTGANSFTGNQTLLSGSLVIGTAGQGVNFSAATPGPNMTSQLLSDYEEGSFTPELKDGITGNVATATTYARYTKIGRVVQFQIYLSAINTTGLTAGNTVYITGLPYVNSNVANAYISTSVFADFGFNSTTGSMSALIYQGTSLMVVYNDLTTGGSAAKISQITSGTGGIVIAGTYQTP